MYQRSSVERTGHVAPTTSSCDPMSVHDSDDAQRILLSDSDDDSGDGPTFSHPTPHTCHCGEGKDTDLPWHIKTYPLEHPLGGAYLCDGDNISKMLDTAVICDAVECVYERRGPHMCLQPAPHPANHKPICDYLKKEKYSKKLDDGKFVHTPMFIAVGDMHFRSIFLSQDTVYFFDPLNHHRNFPVGLLEAMADLCTRTGRVLIPIDLKVQHDCYNCGVWALLAENIWHHWTWHTDMSQPFHTYFADVLLNKYNITPGNDQASKDRTNIAIATYRANLSISHGVDSDQARSRTLAINANKLPAPYTPAWRELMHSTTRGNHENDVAFVPTPGSTIAVATTAHTPAPNSTGNASNPCITLP